jgi:hypothetical protein
MPINTTYAQGFNLPGRVYSDMGYTIETFQGYAQIPTTPTASVSFLDIQSPNPLAPVPLVIPGTSTTQRQYLAILGTVLGADVTLSAAGTLKIAPLTSGLATDATLTAANCTSAVPRNAAGSPTLAATIPRGSTFIAGGLPISGLTTGGSFPVPTTYQLFGATNDTAAATAVNMSSPAANRVAVVVCTIVTLVRKFRTQTVADYPDLPRSIRDAITSIVS